MRLRVARRYHVRYTPKLYETDHLIPTKDIDRIRREMPSIPVYVYPAGHAFDHEHESAPARLAHSRTLELFASEI